MKYTKVLFYLSFISLWLFGCSDNTTEPKIESGTQFPAEGTYEGFYWPTQVWRNCAPEEVGMDSDLLIKAYDYAADPDFKTYSILIAKDGYIVGEAYLNNITVNTLLPGYSFAKSFTSAIVGIALDMQYIHSVDENVYEYIPQWNYTTTDSIKRRVKIKHLLSMTGGLDWNYDSLIVDDYVLPYNENYLQYVLTKDIIYEPGTHWNYSNGEAILISGVLENALNRHGHYFAEQYLFNKIGLSQIIWSTDASGQTNTAYGIWASTRGYAKLGYLYSNNGRWDEEQVISIQWIRQSVTPISEEFNHYGYYWWLLPGFENYDQYDIPDSTFLAVGAQGQRMYIIPENNLVILRMGDGTGTDENPWDTMKFLSLVLESIID